MISVQRIALESEFRKRLSDPSLRHLHIVGLSGSGKSRFVAMVAPTVSTHVCTIDCRNKESCSPISIVQCLASVLLSGKQYGRWLVATNQRMAASILPPASVSSQHSLTMSGNAQLTAQRVIIGNEYHRTEDEIERESWIQANLGLEQLCEVCDRKPSPPILLIFDQFENVVPSGSLSRWISTKLLSEANRPTLNIVVITVSKNSDTVACDSQIQGQLHVGALSTDEADSLLRELGVASDEGRELLAQITQRHALALTLAGHLWTTGNGVQCDVTSVEGSVRHELVVRFLLEQVLRHEKDNLLSSAIKYLPVLRLITPDAVKHLLNISADQVANLITQLLARGYIEQIGTAFRYHDLLRELTLKYIEVFEGKERLSQIHQDAADYYRQLATHERGEAWPIVETFHHLFAADPTDALSFFENHCKYALDRKNRLLSKALVSEVLLDHLNPGTTKAWYLLRVSGYFRQFRQYEFALRLLSEAAQMSEPDSELLARILNNIGWCYVYYRPAQHAEDAIRLFDSSNAICRKHALSSIEAMNLNNIGIVLSHSYTSSFDPALDFFQQSLRITESTEHPVPLVAAMSYRNMALWYHEHSDFATALQYYTESVSRYAAASDPAGEAECLHQIGRILHATGRLEESRVVLDNALLKMRVNPDPLHIAETFFSLAQLFDSLGDAEHLQQCLGSMCLQSLDEGLMFHRYTVSRLIQYSAFLCATHGHDHMSALLAKVVEIWSQSQVGCRIPQFGEFICKWTTDTQAVVGWRHPSARTLHKHGSKRCRPKSWLGVSLVIDHTNAKQFRPCKLCFGASDLTSSFNTDSDSSSFEHH